MLAVLELALDSSYPFVVHNWCYALDRVEEHLAEAQSTCCYTLGEPECAAAAAAADTGSSAWRTQTGPQTELEQLEQLVAC